MPLRASMVAVVLAASVPVIASGGEEPLTASDVRVRTALLLGGGGLAVFAYGKEKWWSDGFTDSFRARKEGWFGRETYAGGADKLGHAYGTYIGTRGLARALEWAGNDERSALRIAAWSALGAYTAIEVLDGYSRRWTFSREDALANAAGVGAAILLERYPGLDRLMDFRLLYMPRDDSHSFAPLSDYSGQTYLLVFKAAGVPELRAHPALRYLEVSAGYGARGFDDGPEARAGRSRSLYLGISLNLAEVLSRTAFRDTAPSDWKRRATNGLLEVWQPPATVVPLARSRSSP